MAEGGGDGSGRTYSQQNHRAPVALSGGSGERKTNPTDSFNLPVAVINRALRFSALVMLPQLSGIDLHERRWRLPSDEHATSRRGDEQKDHCALMPQWGGHTLRISPKSTPFSLKLASGQSSPVGQFGQRWTRLKISSECNTYRYQVLPLSWVLDEMDVYIRRIVTKKILYLSIDYSIEQHIFLTFFLFFT